MTVRIAILISGSGSNMVKLVESMTGAHPGRPVLVLSNSPEAAGLQKAEALGVPTVTVDHRPFGADRKRFEAQMIKALDAVQPDILCFAGFMRILTPGFINHYAGKMLNIHPSLLPKFKGLKTHAQALAAGDAEHGCTVHEVTADLDGGPILGQAQVRVMPGDTPVTLAARVLEQEHRLYPAVLSRYLAGERRPLLLP